MKYDQYLSLIQRLEEYAKSNPRTYTYKVVGLALVGYSYFFGLILLFLLVPVVLVFMLINAPASLLRIALFIGKFWFVLIPMIAAFFGFLGGAVKSLFAKVPGPEGRPLTAAEAPELFDFVRETCRALDSKQPEKVLITSDFNAAVVTLPRIGIFGRKVYLCLGLPLMSALSPEQFKAVLAHEIGHISAKHGAFAKWAYQLHESWGRFIDSQAASEHKFATLYEKFFNWFFPYFTAYSFVLNREHEKEADTYAVELIGARPLGEALITLETRCAQLQEAFWKDIGDQNMTTRIPPKQIFSKMLASLEVSGNGREAEILRMAIEVPTDYNDSHPSLADRLRQIRYWKDSDLPPLPESIDSNAAKQFLSPILDGCVVEFDITWDQQIENEWAPRYEHFQKSRRRLEELEARAMQETLSPEEMVETAALVAEQKGHEEALRILRRAVSLYPEHPEVNYNLGGVLLALNDESGLEHLSDVMKIDAKWRLASSGLAFQFLRSKGRFEEAKQFASAMEGEYEKLEKAQKERNDVMPSDRFEPHTLPPETVDKIIAKLKYYDEIKALYLVRKSVEHLPDVPFHVLFIEPRKPRRFGGGSQLKGQDLIRIAVERLEDCEIHYLVALEKDFKSTKPQLEEMPGAKILDVDA